MSISTGGRTFAAQMIRETRPREKRRARTRCAGTTKWTEALEGFGSEMGKCKSPTHAGKVFATLPRAADHRAQHTPSLLRELLRRPQAQRHARSASRSMRASTAVGSEHGKGQPPRRPPIGGTFHFEILVMSPPPKTCPKTVSA